LSQEERRWLNPPASPAPAGENTGGFIPLPYPLKRKIKDGMVALAVANGCFFRAWSGLLFDGVPYFKKLPVAGVELLALAVNILGLALLIWLGIGLWRRTRSRLLQLLLDVTFLFLAFFSVDYFRYYVFHWWIGGVFGFLHRPVLLLALFVIAAGLIWKHRLAARVAAMVVVVTFPVALLILAKITLLSLHVMHLRECTEAAPPPPLLHRPEGQPRVLWIIFDETDYRLVFPQRPASLRLPEFDHLRQVALCADQAYPPSDATIISMPALIAGRRLSSVKTDDCDLALTFADTGATMGWTDLPSVFSQARGLGVNTAVVGWYHPYSRVLGGSLNYCSWYQLPNDTEAERSTTFGGAIQQQIACLAAFAQSPRLFIAVCRSSLNDALSVVADPTYGLILLHLPPPHAPWVFLPEKNEFTVMGFDDSTGYLNNLALADHELGEMRRAMETSGQWNKTWLILSADHSWRKSKIYDGVRDYRVPFLVKPAGAGQSLTYSNQFNTVLTHDLILAILRGAVTNQPTTAAWLDTHGKPELPVLGTFTASGTYTSTNAP
jgi:hypothetical protein